MKPSNKWNRLALQQSPLFSPLFPVLALLQDEQFPTIFDFNEQLSALGAQVQRGHPLHFVPQEMGRMGFEEQYEPRCYLTGEVQTRPDNWHDLFNALVWLTFPKAKAAINARHFKALNHQAGPRESQRGKVRDMATLLDESGVIVVTCNADLSEMICEFRWTDLFWTHREETRTEMGFFIFGHGLYEKALNPYIGMTGQGLILNVSADFFTGTLKSQLNYLDEQISAYINNPSLCLNPRELHPVPLLGIPGWYSDNDQAAFYENATYFRPGRRE